MTIDEKRIELNKKQRELSQEIARLTRQRDAANQAIGQLSAQLLGINGGLEALASLTAEALEAAQSPEG